MKRILYLMIVAAMLCIGLASCMKIDNWDEPGSQFSGKVIDSYTGQNLMIDQNDWSIRIWEKTWTASVAQYQSIPIKADGTYNNTKLFSGTYDMLAYGGPFWPCDTVKSVVLGKSTVQDFTVTPYLQVINFVATLNGTSLTLTCNVKAPRITGLPNLYDVKAFLSLTTFCGNSNYINIAEYNNLRKQINKSWAAEVGTSDTSGTYSIGPLPVKSGYTYYVRIGASVNDANRKYNYSPIVKVVVP